MYKEIYLKTEIRFYDDNININFYDSRMPEQGSHCFCLSVILIDSVFNMGKNYFPQVFWEEYKF